MASIRVRGYRALVYGLLVLTGQSSFAQVELARADARKIALAQKKEGAQVGESAAWLCRMQRLNLKREYIEWFVDHARQLDQAAEKSEQAEIDGFPVNAFRRYVKFFQQRLSPSCRTGIWDTLNWSTELESIAGIYRSPDELDRQLKKIIDDETKLNLQLATNQAGMMRASGIELRPSGEKCEEWSWNPSFRAMSVFVDGKDVGAQCLGAFRLLKTRGNFALLALSGSGEVYFWSLRDGSDWESIDYTWSKTLKVEQVKGRMVLTYVNQSGIVAQLDLDTGDRPAKPQLDLTIVAKPQPSSVFSIHRTQGCDAIGRTSKRKLFAVKYGRESFYSYCFVDAQAVDIGGSVFVFALTQDGDFQVKSAENSDWHRFATTLEAASIVSVVLVDGVPTVRFRTTAGTIKTLNVYGDVGMP